MHDGPRAAPAWTSSTAPPRRPSWVGLPDGRDRRRSGHRPRPSTRTSCASGSTAWSASTSGPARSTPRAGTAALFVYVPRGVEVELPVEAILTATGAAGRVFGRTLVVVEEGAKATVIDRYGSTDVAGPVHASSVVELYVGQGAELEHVSVIDWGAGVRHHAMLRASRGPRREARSVVVTLGGDVVRVEPTMVVAGPGADARALGLYFAGGDQHFEHRVVARHEAPQAYSNLLYKGAIQDHAHTVFFGNLVVPPGRARHRRVPDQPQPGAQRRRPRRHDPVPRDRDGRGEVLPRRRGRPRGRRAPLLPPVAGRPRRPRPSASS